MFLARRRRSAASNSMRSRQNELNRLKMTERRQQESVEQRQTRLRSLQSRDCDRFAFRYDLLINYSLIRHALSGTIVNVCLNE